MIEKGQISSFQMGLVMYPTIIATAILIVPAITAAPAGRDMWLSPLWGLVTGVVTIFICIKLNDYYPKKTIIEYSTDIIGSIPAKLLGFGYLFFLFHVSGVIVREYADFIVGIFMLQTPVLVVITGMVLVSAFAVRGGLEVIARSSEFFVPIVVFILFFIIVLLVPELDFLKMLPIFEDGITPSIKGAASIQAWYSEFFIIAFFLPFLSDREKAMKWSLLSLVMIAITLVLTNLATFMLYGMLTEELSYPLISATRYVSIADFFENIESIVMALWVAGAFIKITAFYYAFVLGTAQLFKLSSYRPIVFPLGIMLIVSSIWAAQSFTEVKDALGKAVPFYLPLFGTIIPFLLFLVAVVKKKVKKSPQQQKQA
ncbi:endospore germination permease [Evansella sp. AB-P1]|uniref:GerAB/ArcD/ProY family transporter n=1 Tax=Evansella sp. AB-P1 TaxID=3037653 RepID=UPI00241FA470|nr:endospore germination permease [Evansella sp. AB-P1]MDG5786806.1 endospore germination permease [Evansella sp. AB-P1]